HIPAGRAWATTTFEVEAGTVYRIIAHGRWTDARGVASGPDGVCPEQALSYLGPAPTLSDADRDANYLNGQPRGGLIARVSVQGNHPRDVTFFASSSVSFVAPEDGP